MYIMRWILVFPYSCCGGFHNTKCIGKLKVQFLMTHAAITAIFKGILKTYIANYVHTYIQMVMICKGEPNMLA